MSSLGERGQHTPSDHGPVENSGQRQRVDPRTVTRPGQVNPVPASDRSADITPGERRRDLHDAMRNWPRR